MIIITEETIFEGRDNTFTIEYVVNGIPFDFTNTTKVEFTLNNKMVDSVTYPDYFDFSVGTDGRIIFNFGSAGYTRKDSGGASVIIFDNSNTRGLVLSTPRGLVQLNITVI